MVFLVIFCFAGCLAEATSSGSSKTENPAESQMEQMNLRSFDKNTRITDVINDSSFGDYGRLIFPADTRYYSGDTLEELRLTWYNNISPDKTVEIVNYLKSHADAGETVFYDIYTEEEKAADPDKKIRGCSFSKAIPVKSLLCATQAADLLMWEQCRTVSLMHWNYQKKAITPLL